MFGVVNIQNVDDIDTFFEQHEVSTGAQTVTTRVPLGSYSVSLLSFQDVGFSETDLVHDWGSSQRSRSSPCGDHARQQLDQRGAGRRR